MLSVEAYDSALPSTLGQDEVQIGNQEQISLACYPFCGPVADPGFEKGGFRDGMRKLKVSLIFINFARTPGPVVTTKPKATFHVDIP